MGAVGMVSTTLSCVEGSDLDLHPNIEVRLFNPIALRGACTLGTMLDFGRVNRRRHKTRGDLGRHLGV